MRTRRAIVHVVPGICISADVRAQQSLLFSSVQTSRPRRLSHAFGFEASSSFTVSSCKKRSPFSSLLLWIQPKSSRSQHNGGLDEREDESFVDLLSWQTFFFKSSLCHCSPPSAKNPERQIIRKRRTFFPALLSQSVCPCVCLPLTLWLRLIR